MLHSKSFEHFFGALLKTPLVVRRVIGGVDRPTVTSYLQLFRLLCLHYPASAAIRVANIDSANEEGAMHLLTTYKEIF